MCGVSDGRSTTQRAMLPSCLDPDAHVGHRTSGLSTRILRPPIRVSKNIEHPGVERTKTKLTRSIRHRGLIVSTPNKGNNTKPESFCTLSLRSISARTLRSSLSCVASILCSSSIFFSVFASRSIRSVSDGLHSRTTRRCLMRLSATSWTIKTVSSSARIS